MLTEHVTDLQRALVTTRALELNCHIEASRVAGTEGVAALFRTITGKIATARRELEELSQASCFSSSREVREGQHIRQSLDAIRDLVAAMGDPALIGSK